MKRPHSKKQNNRNKNIGKIKDSNKIQKVKSSNKSPPACRFSLRSKKIDHTPDQNTMEATESESDTENDNTKQVWRPTLSKKVSRIYFDAYSKLPRKQKVYDLEETKQPIDLPAMKLLEAVHGISSYYANEYNSEIEGLFDTPALLCLGMLVEEYTKYCTTDFSEKFTAAENAL